MSEDVLIFEPIHSFFCRTSLEDKYIRPVIEVFQSAVFRGSNPPFVIEYEILRKEKLRNHGTPRHYCLKIALGY